MVTQSALRWVFTVAFVGFGMDSAWRIVVVSSVAGRVRLVLHALMSAAMAVMVWPAGMELAPVAQGAFFLLAALWFVFLIRPHSRGRLSWRCDEDHSRWHYLFHAAKMAAMAWMFIAMSPVFMNGMAAGGGHHHGLPVGAALVSVVFLMMMLAVAAVFSVDGWSLLSRIKLSHHAHAVELLSIAGMSAGMAAMFVPLVAV